MMKTIPLSVPHMSGREQAYVAEAFASNWLSTVGPHIAAFERQFEQMLGIRAVALVSGTAALHLGLRALGVGPGDTVFCSDLTFIASLNAVRYVIVDRGDNGHSRLALANLAGAFAGGFVGNAYLPDPYANASHGLSRSALALTGFVTSNLADEFHPEIRKVARKLHLPLVGR